MPATGPHANERPKRRPPAATSGQLASYIEDMLREMERLAAGSDLRALRALLRKAREEAGRHAQE
jgi:hypothetical protein